MVTVFTVLLVLTLSVFSALTLTSARADLALSRTNARTVSAYYAADAEAAALPHAGQQQGRQRRKPQRAGTERRQGRRAEHVVACDGGRRAHDREAVPPYPSGAGGGRG